MITVEVVYTTPKEQMLFILKVPINYSISQVIQKAQIHTKFSTFKLNMVDAVGVFGKKVSLTEYVLKDGDRIELYRKLQRTPNQRRLSKI